MLQSKIKQIWSTVEKGFSRTRCKDSFDKMFLSYATFCFLSLLPIQTVHGQQTKVFKQKKTRSVFGKYLKDHVFMTTEQAEDPQHCLADCWSEGDRCESFNFLVLYNMCELNNRSKENAPDDYIDRDDVVYFTNTNFGKGKIPEMARHTEQYSSGEGSDPCASSPCQNGGKCVLDAKTGFYCDKCNDDYYGLMCEQRPDPCMVRPCKNGGTCISLSNFTAFTCNCIFPTKGKDCTTVDNAYKVVLSGTSDVAMLRPRSLGSISRFAFWFWFQTNDSLSYLTSFLPDDPKEDEVFSFWKSGSTFYVELWRDNITKFSFPHTYPLDDFSWHFVLFTFRSGSTQFYLDGAHRSTRLPPGPTHFHAFPAGVLRLGAYKDSNGRDYYSNGSISGVDFTTEDFYYNKLEGNFLRTCSPFQDMWSQDIWTGFHLTQKISLCDRVTNGVPKYFQLHQSPSHWLEQAVSPSRDLAAFTLSFWLKSAHYPVSWPFLLVCYGSNGDHCSFSVTIQTNLTLAIVVSSYRAVVDLIPIFDFRPHHVLITWTSQGGVLEVIIDMVLQSRLVNINNGAIVQGQNRFLIGGSDVAEMNFRGHLDKLNLWDEVLPVALLYLMSLYPGEDRGNVVSWKTFYKPSISVTVVDSAEYSYSSVGRYNSRLLFKSETADNFCQMKVCCVPRKQITVAMWHKFDHLPAVLLSYETRNSEREVYLSIDTHGNITWMLRNSEISIGNISRRRNAWHFIAITWTNQGQLHSYVDGVHDHVSSSYKVASKIYGNGAWFLGSKNMSFVGSVMQANVWDIALPIPSLRALSRGATNLVTRAPPTWDDFNALGAKKGNISSLSPGILYTPSYNVQILRDVICKSVMPRGGCSRYYARLGIDGEDGFRLGCFCGSELTEDKNYNFSGGDFSHHSQLNV